MSTAYVFPGQGSQKKGMGKDLFDKYEDLIRKSDEILKYSIKELCLQDPGGRLVLTQYAQVAIYIVNTMYYYEMLQKHKKPDFVAGHSLGEFNALQVAGAFDFETGLRLVQKRGEIMSQATDGGMAAIIGSDCEHIVHRLIREYNLTSIDIANYNAPSQLVIAGLTQDILQTKSIIEKSGLKYFPLNVSGAFHSKQMKNSSEEFGAFLNNCTFNSIEIPVISNLTARPYKEDEIKSNLTNHLINPVKWTESIRYLMGKGCNEYIEVGDSIVLTGLITKIKNESKPLILNDMNKQDENNTYSEMKDQKNIIYAVKGTDLGSTAYKKSLSLKYAYSAGSMYKGVSSSKMVVALAKAGVMSYFGTGGLSLKRIEEEINTIQDQLNNKFSFGMNLIYNLYEPEKENSIVELYTRKGITNIEASAYMQVSLPLVKFRIKGLVKGEKNEIISKHKIQAKISRPEIAQLFLSPPPPKMIEQLLANNEINEQQAEMAQNIPLATDLCVEADSGGHTDRGIMTVLLPTLCRLRNEMRKKYKYKEYICVGAAGGIGTPEAAAAALVMGADFIQTGSINQCTVEAGISDSVKTILESINVQDTDYAPAGDMFELGAKVQVVKKGILFSARANKLYELYRQYNSMDEIDEKQLNQLEKTYFKRSIDEIYQSCKAYYPEKEILKAEKNPKYKMALIFRWYFGYCNNAALQGDEENKVNYQIHCGSALGAFNQWVKGTELEKWQNRHVDELAIKLMDETAEYLNHNLLPIFKMNQQV